MTRMRSALMIGALLGLALGSCSKPAPETLNGTALYVTNLFNSDYRVRALLFIGQNAEGNEVFQRATRPEPPSATDIFAPQRVRILLPDALAGKELTLSVYALDSTNEYVEYGTAVVTPKVGRETDVTVNMKPFNDLPVDAGVDAGTDAGKIDSGVVDAGRCDCPTGCCIPDAGQPDGSSCAPSGTSSTPLGGMGTLVFTIQFCGPPKTMCRGGIWPNGDFCDPIRATGCSSGLNPACVCGSEPQCAPGMRCSDATMKGVFSCVCDTFSECLGCCGTGPSGPACKSPPVGTACGSGGLACEVCLSAGTAATCSLGASGGPGACNPSSACLACTSVGKCCTGSQCASGDYPTCRLKAAPSPSICQACDILRTDRCSPAGQCACGATATCGPNQFCIRDAGPGGLGACSGG